MSKSELGKWFWFPISSQFVPTEGENGSIGKVIVAINSGFTSFCEVIENFREINQPFTVSILWNLLFTLARCLVVFEDCLS